MNITGKYLKVWKVKESNGYTKLDLGDSQKNKNGEYDNWTWFDCALFGEAAKKSFSEGDLVEVTSGQIYQEKYNDKWYTKVKIFHIQKMDQENKPTSQPYSKPATENKFASYKPNAPKVDDFSSYQGGGAGIDDSDIPF